MSPAAAPHWVSMTRIGVEFGWSVRHVANILETLGYRKHATPTPQALPWIKEETNPLGLPVYKWNLEGMVDRLQAHGYPVADPVQVQLRLGWQDCQAFFDAGHRYVQGNKRKQQLLERVSMRGEVLRTRLASLSPRQRAEVLLGIDLRLRSPGQAHLWSPTHRQKLLRWMGSSECDLQACALLLATPEPRCAAQRPRL